MNTMLAVGVFRGYAFIIGSFFINKQLPRIFAVGLLGLWLTAKLGNWVIPFAITLFVAMPAAVLTTYDSDWVFAVVLVSAFVLQQDAMTAKIAARWRRQD